MSNDYDGLEVKLFKEFSRRWGSNSGHNIDLVLVGLDINDRFQAIKSGRVDLVIAAITSSNRFCTEPAPTDNKPLVCTAKPYVSDEQKALVSSSAISDSLDICMYFGLNKRIGVIKNTTFQQQMDSMFLACPANKPSITERGNRKEIVEAIIQGSIDVYITNGRLLEYYRDHSSNPTALKIVELIDTKTGKVPPIFPESFVVAMLKEREGLQQLIDNTLVAMTDDGSYEAIYKESNLSGPTYRLAIDKQSCSDLRSVWMLVKDTSNADATPRCQLKP